MKVKLFSGIVAEFQSLSLAPTHSSVFGISTDGRYVVKVELFLHPEKKNDLKAEAEIIRYLNDRGCVSCPILYGLSEVDGKTVNSALSADAISARGPVSDDTIFQVMVTEALQRMNPVFTPDIMMAVIEQKKLGVWHSDPDPAHAYFDPKTNAIKFIDYDQAFKLDQEQIDMPNAAYFEWINEYQKTISNGDLTEGFLHYFLGIKWETHFAPFLDGDSFAIGQTHLFKSQETTLNPSKIYHSFRTQDVFADGERSLDDRTQFLDKLDFAPQERVLDVGCNAGLLSRYLADRDCNVWGIDIDPSIIDGARILSNIFGYDNIEFECHDLDNGGPIGFFDTIFLFSVIHHTQNIEKNAARIAKLCNRIIIECRLEETGAKPVGDKWIQTTVWRHDNLEELLDGLKGLFPGFEDCHVVGQGDRDRYMIEMLKPSATCG